MQTQDTTILQYTSIEDLIAASIAKACRHNQEIVEHAQAAEHRERERKQAAWAGIIAELQTRLPVILHAGIQPPGNYEPYISAYQSHTEEGIYNPLPIWIVDKPLPPLSDQLISDCSHDRCISGPGLYLILAYFCDGEFYFQSTSLNIDDELGLIYAVGEQREGATRSDLKTRFFRDYQLAIAETVAHYNARFESLQTLIKQRADRAQVNKSPKRLEMSDGARLLEAFERFIQSRIEERGIA